MTKLSSQLVQSIVSTLSLASVGTMALVGAHHLGRKQYDANAKLSDYSDGLKDRLTTLASLKSATPHQPTNQPAKRSCTESVQSSVTSQVKWISGVADLKTHDFAVVAIDNQRDIVWQTAMPERVHDILIQPHSIQPQHTINNCIHVTIMGRRPSEYFWVLDSATGDILHTIKANHNRHFYGHACYSLDGTTLYITENDTATFAGKIGVYDVKNGYQKSYEFDTHGIGPHELVMHPDGDTLVIANGGIKTEKASRDELNLDSMQPSLVYVNRYTGELLEQIYPEHNQMSVRHLSMGDNGVVAIGIQFQGERHLSVPLLLTHRRGDSSLTPLTIPKNDPKGWYRYHQYIASVVIDSAHQLLCATSPIGGVASVFDLTTGVLLDTVALPDCAGATLWQYDDKLDRDNIDNKTDASDTPSFLVSDGQGYLSKLNIFNNNESKSTLSVDKVHCPVAFDNHLKQL